MNILTLLFYCYIVICLQSTLFSQTPIQKWEFGKIANFLDKEFVHGYSVGVTLEGNSFVNCHHDQQFPLFVSVDPSGKEVFNAERTKPPLTDAVYKIRIEADEIYKSSVIERGQYYAIHNTWIDSTNTIFYPSDLYFNRFSSTFGGNSTFTNDHKHFQFFYSSTFSRHNFADRYFTRIRINIESDSIYTEMLVFRGNNSGQISGNLDSIYLGSIHLNDVRFIPKPKALRWFTNNGQGRNLYNKKLGMMISADTVIPSLKSITQVRTSGKNSIDLKEKFDEVVDVNPYLLENYSGKRLKWKGFTNSSFGFVALYENLDDNNRNILFRYKTETQSFSTVPLDVNVDCRSLCIDSIGALAIVGTKNNEGNNDFYLGFFNSMGELSEQSWGGEEYDRLNDCVIDSLGEIAVSGQKGNDLYLAKFTFNVTSVSDKGKNSVPTFFVHQGNSSSTVKEIEVEDIGSGFTTIKLYNMQGQYISTIYEGEINENAKYRFPVHTNTLANGVYYIVLQNSNQTLTKNFVNIR